MGTTLLSSVGSVAGAGMTDAELFAAARDGDPAAREALVRRFLPMARRLAWRYRRGGEPADDLVQVASVALVKALERFDPDRGVPFSGYAVPTIVGELKRHLRDTRWAAYVPQRMRERVLEVDRATEPLRRTLGRSPTVEEVAEETRDRGRRGGRRPGGRDRLRRRLAGLAGVRLAGRGGVHGPDALGADEAAATSSSSTPSTIEPALRALPARQRVILGLRFQEDMTQAEIATRLGISQMHVSRLLRQALGRLREVARVRQQRPRAARRPYHGGMIAPPARLRD